MDNTRFAFRKKSFPRVSDEGEVDVHLAGNGLTFEIDMRIEPNADGDMIFSTEGVRANIDKLDINLHDTHHKYVPAMLRYMLTSA